MEVAVLLGALPEHPALSRLVFAVDEDEMEALVDEIRARQRAAGRHAVTPAVLFVGGLQVVVL